MLLPFFRANGSLATLRKAIFSMPRVPATSKKARKVLSSEPLVPESIQADRLSRQQKQQQQPRRSSRLQSLPTTEPPPAQPVKLAGASFNSDAGGKLTKASGKGTAGARKSSKSKPASLAVVKEEASLAAEAGTSDGPKVKKRKVSIDHEKARPVKIEDGESVEKTKPKKAKLPKAKPSTANGSATDLKVEKEESPPPIESKDPIRLGKVIRKKKAPAKPVASTKDGQEGIQEDATAAEVVKKKKKNRRGPSGYALIGEGVEDSAADRRARLKAARSAGPAALDTVPPVLDSEVTRMCAELGNEALGRTAPWDKIDGKVGGLQWWTGCHVSTSGGMEKAVINAAAIGCRAFALDTRCKMRWESPALSDETAIAFKNACKTFGFGPEQILPHGSYLINLASPDPDMAEKGFGGFLDELQRCEKLGLSMYNFHPGSTTGLCTHEESMDRIAAFINRAHKATKGVTVVLENMSSVGNIVGGRPWHLRYIIDRVEDKSRIGYCIDTCHLFSSGMDLQTEESCEATFQKIDEVVGLKYLRGMHVNDSKTPFDSHRDRHENIGRGSIPIEAFRWIMNNPKFQGIPLIMETPVQEREPPVNYKLSLEHGRVQWKDPEGPYGVGTDRRDVMLLNSLIEPKSK